MTTDAIHSQTTATADFSVGLASIEDIDGILAVQEANQPEHGGRLSARFTREWFAQAVQNQWLLVARSGTAVVGYVAFTSQQAQSQIPLIQAMLSAYPNPAAYLHGPICVAQDFRRRGVASALFSAQRAHRQQAPVMSFIREDNQPSRQAHIAMGLREVEMFTFGSTRFVIVTG
jgi:predicted N-acetyltransferase YhbS